MTIIEKINYTHYNLSPSFIELIKQVKNDDEKYITIRDIFFTYNGSKRRGHIIVREIELIFSLIGIKSDYLLDDYGFDDEIKLVSTNSGLKIEFRKIIEEVHENGEMKITPEKIILYYSDSFRRTNKLVHEIQFVFKLFNIKTDSFYPHDCGFNDEIMLKSTLNNIEKKCTTKLESAKISVQYAGEIRVENGKNPKTLYLHQTEAIKKLDEKIIKTNKSPFAGLLVLPTGGGKTTVAVQWLLKNYIDKNKKVVWIAHRHELLEQAKETFGNNAYSDILKNRTSFKYRIISGLHDKPVNIQNSDDIIIASKDSLNSGLEYLLDRLNNVELFLVVDEAHHAIAKTYRKLINSVENNVRDFRMLGLTATPFRTSESEKGLLAKLFTDEIVYGIDLRTLINRGILSEPIFYEQKTNFKMYDVFDDNAIEKIQHFDISSIGKDVAKNIGENKTRNNNIVDYYVKNKNKFKQTLIFALNVDNAIALNALFKRKGIASDYIVSAIRDASTGITTSAKDNKNKIDKFRNGDLKVLINVNILTEGTDLPKVQTVFLTRPTISKILMTQMIGRGLRGEKAGGTKNTFIVSFIDDWKDKISWVNPEKLYIEDSIDFKDTTSSNTVSKIIRLISIEKIEEFANIMDATIDTRELEKIDFIERIPIGLYSFEILKSEQNDELEKNCEILVYDNIKQAYFDFINELDYFFSINNLNDIEELNEHKLQELSKKVEYEYFDGYDTLIGYRIEDIKDILKYYSLYENIPAFIKFEERDKFDIKKIAKEIINRDFGEKSKDEHLRIIWENDGPHWKAFCGYSSFEYFSYEVYLSIRKEYNPDYYKRTISKPEDIKELRELEKLTMSELHENSPKHWRELKNKIYEMSKDENGFYTCAISGEKSNKKNKFQIDHIKPMSKGGLTTLENLQILTRKENAIKSNN